jgi:Ulp1 family protease
LRNGEWFSDNIVDAYSYLWSNAVSGPLFRVAYLSAYFYDLLSKKRPLSEEMQRWICKIDIKLLDLFFLPIHTPNHYSLVLIHPKMHTIAYCDSMPGLADPQTILRDVVTFISPQFPNEKWDRWNISALKVRKSYMLDDHMR